MCIFCNACEKLRITCYVKILKRELQKFKKQELQALNRQELQDDKLDLLFLV
jgi:Na+-translocating ferredoxin:NAD+ oxidoreductase RnfC subunit